MKATHQLRNASEMDSACLRLLLPGAQTAENSDTLPATSTDEILCSISRTSFRLLGIDPLAAFDTEVLITQSSSHRLTANTITRQIMMSARFFQNVEFAAAFDVFRAVRRDIVSRMNERGEPTSDLVSSIRESDEAFYSLFISRLFLQMAGEAEAADITKRFTPRRRDQIIDYRNLTLLFALLHEQGHIAFSDGASFPTLRGGVARPFVDVPLSPAQQEERAADLWALRQIPETLREFILSISSNFFLCHWILDYIAYEHGQDHPPVLSRIQFLEADLPRASEQKGPFARISDKLAEQTFLSQGMLMKSRRDRYREMVRFCREAGSYEKLGDAAHAFSHFYEHDLGAE